MARAALAPGVAAAGVAFIAGWLAADVGTGVSAALGSVVAVGGFAGQVLALGWARTVSLTAVQAVALSGLLVLFGLVFAVYVVLNATASWFAPKAFGLGLLALVPVAFYEAYQARRGKVAELIVDADRAAAARSKGPA
jgi:hypothetical protein